MINLRKVKQANPTVEDLLARAKSRLIDKLAYDGLTLRAWAYCQREAILLPNETMADATVSKLFPLACKFGGEPVNSSTYKTAQRALLADYSIFIEGVNKVTPTEQET